MLKTLTVQNYALINELQLHFGKELNIITGETGAGKSVLMGALGLLLGDRADSSALSDATKKCMVVGVFQASKKVKQFLESVELDSDDELIIHREINKDGKSRSFINDTPVNLSTLKELGNILVEIHSQHETLLLNQSGFQLSVVDAFASHDKLIAEYRIQFKKYKKLNEELNNLKEAENKSRLDQDYFQFQFNEMEEARIQPGEQKLLEEEISTLSHAAEIQDSINKFTAVVSESEENLLAGLAGASNVISGLGRYSTSFDNSANRIKALLIELKDIESEVIHSAQNIHSNPKRLQLVSDRLDVLYRLQQKHRVDSAEDLIVIRDSFQEKLNSFNSLAEMIDNASKEKEKVFTEVKNLADKISDNRLKSIPGIESKIRKLLADVSMPDSVLKIELNPVAYEELNNNGKDKIRFLFSANKGSPFSDISKVASGGELSRLMLCIKACVAKLIEMPTIVFDEIDTGVSGETAFKIGQVMQGLSKAHQLIAITHLPQIAGRGGDHFFVYKETVGKKTFTRVKKLSADERIVEVARMLSGDKPTTVAMQNAKELLKN